jgi:hypothetical protein
MEKSASPVELNAGKLSNRDRIISSGDYINRFAYFALEKNSRAEMVSDFLYLRRSRSSRKDKIYRLAHTQGHGPPLGVYSR